MNDVFAEIIRRPHPALVHFPISLFPVSALFVLIAQAQNYPDLLTASYWCFLIAAIMMIPVALTGMLDFVRLKVIRTLKGHRLMMLHLFNGALSTLAAGIAGVYFWQNPPQLYPHLLQAYTVTTIALSIMVLAQGVIAALMIYQHKLGVDGETR